MRRPTSRSTSGPHTIPVNACAPSIQVINCVLKVKHTAANNAGAIASRQERASAYQPSAETARWNIHQSRMAPSTEGRAKIQLGG